MDDNPDWGGGDDVRGGAAAADVASRTEGDVVMDEDNTDDDDAVSDALSRELTFYRQAAEESDDGAVDAPALTLTSTVTMVQHAKYHLAVSPNAGIFGILSRPVSATPNRMKSLAACALALKIDGTRAMVFVSSGGRVEALIGSEQSTTLIGSDSAPFDPSVHKLSVLDCELHPNGTFFAFDMLLYDDCDIRHRTLSERVELAGRRMPTFLRAKPYRIASSAEDSRVCARALLEQLTDDCDGIIVLNSTDPYWTSPIKFKENLTCDFLLEGAANGDGFVLYSESTTDAPAEVAAPGRWVWPSQTSRMESSSSAGWSEAFSSRENWSPLPPPPPPPLACSTVRLKSNSGSGKGAKGGKGGKGRTATPVKSKCGGRSWPGDGAAAKRNSSRFVVRRDGPKGEVARLRPPQTLLSKLDIRADIQRDDACVVECSRTKKGSWTLKRRRQDRKKPNSTRVVEQNVALANSCCTSISWFLKALPLQNEVHAFMRWVEACERCVISQSESSNHRVALLSTLSQKHQKQLENMFLSSGGGGGRPASSVVFYGSHAAACRPYRQRNNRAKQPRFEYVRATFDGIRKCDRVFSFFTLYPFFESREKLRELALAVAASGASEFSGLMWSGEGGDLHSSGRFSVKVGEEAASTSGPTGSPPPPVGFTAPTAATCVDPDRSDMVSAKLGRRMTLQLPHGHSHHLLYVPSMEALAQAFAEVEYVARAVERMPAPVEMNGCPQPYERLGERLLHFHFVRSPPSSTEWTT